MTYLPVFIDGPLKGERWPIEESTVRYGLRIPLASMRTMADFLASPDASPAFEHVAYTFCRCAIFGRVLLVGTTLPISSRQAEDAAFEMLTSDAAKAAVIDTVPPEPEGPLLPPPEPSSQLSSGDALRLIDQAIAEQAEFAKAPRQRTQESRVR